MKVLDFILSEQIATHLKNRAQENSGLDGAFSGAAMVIVRELNSIQTSKTTFDSARFIAMMVAGAAYGFLETKQ